MLHFLVKSFWATLIDIWQLFTGHTVTLAPAWSCHQVERILDLAGAMVLWLWETTHVHECSEFESWRCILYGHFFTLICCKNCIVFAKAEK